MKIVLTIIVMVGVGFCHHRGRNCVGKCWNHMKPPPPPPPPPPYLRGLDQQARDEYSAIITNNAMTIAEKNQKIEKWAEKHRILDEVHRFNNHTERMKVEMKRNVARLIMELPQAMYKHSLIMENVHQTTLERHYAIQKLDAEDPQVGFLTFTL
ncbi:hypothetical protein RB195_004893 [Necator americanus]|uniref:SXP/RAL-2 family protein Ani s 5-like cation-binding domain-containing protein n=1 Tax=Necator americanus TaxID=51031 RepID=A0ABR1BLT2_NECAM